MMVRAAPIVLFICILVLVLMGITMQASALKNGYYFLSRQTQWVVVGSIAMFVMAFIDYRWLKKGAKYLYIVALVGLILCFVPNIGREIGGENRWIVLPVLGQFQPSEPAKLIVMIALASWYARHKGDITTFWKGFVAPGAILVVPLFLIFIEKDMGTSVGLGLAGVLVMFMAGTRLFFILSVAAVLLGGAVMVIKDNPNRMKRFEAFYDLEKHRYGVGRQQWLALKAFGNGGMHGTGLAKGRVKRLGMPEHHTDFIFAIVGEELGLKWTLAVVAAFVIITVIGGGIALNAPDLFGQLLGVGVTASVVIPAALNMAVVTHLVPNSGLPLPFISYGGSNMLFTMAMMGVLFSLHRHGRIIDYTALPPTSRREHEIPA